MRKGSDSSVFSVTGYGVPNVLAGLAFDACSSLCDLFNFAGALSVCRVEPFLRPPKVLRITGAQPIQRVKPIGFHYGADLSGAKTKAALKRFLRTGTGSVPQR